MLKDSRKMTGLEKITNPTKHYDLQFFTLLCIWAETSLFNDLSVITGWEMWGSLWCVQPTALSVLIWIFQDMILRSIFKMFWCVMDESIKDSHITCRKYKEPEEILTFRFTLQRIRGPTRSVNTFCEPECLLMCWRHLKHRLIRRKPLNTGSLESSRRLQTVSLILIKERNATELDKPNRHHKNNFSSNI